MSAVEIKDTWSNRFRSGVQLASGTVERVVRFLRAIAWFIWRVMPRISVPDRVQVLLSWRMAWWREDMKAARKGNPHGYALDGYGQPTCENCGERTNAHYKRTPNLICWKCGQSVKSNTRLSDKD